MLRRDIGRQQHIKKRMPLPTAAQPQLVGNVGSRVGLAFQAGENARICLAQQVRHAGLWVQTEPQRRVYAAAKNARVFGEIPSGGDEAQDEVGTGRMPPENNAQGHTR